MKVVPSETLCGNAIPSPVDPDCTCSPRTYSGRASIRTRRASEGRQGRQPGIVPARIHFWWVVSVTRHDRPPSSVPHHKPGAVLGHTVVPHHLSRRTATRRRGQPRKIARKAARARWGKEIGTLDPHRSLFFREWLWLIKTSGRHQRQQPLPLR